jgi:L-alanine-DL-glutamate epimerase-like enolase superfamily enzyme
MSVITRITSEPFSLPLRGALQWGAHSRLDSLQHVLVRVRTEHGEGVAEAPVRPTIYGETLNSVQAAISEILAPALVGTDCHDVAAMQKVLGRLPNNHTAKGALDFAIAEAAANEMGKTLLEQLVSRPKRHIDVSYILGIAEVEVMLEEASRVFAAGVRVFKVKVGRNPDADRTIIQTLNEHFAGQGVVLYADANELLEPDSAAKRLYELAELGIAYVEEPLPVELVHARRDLRAAEIVPIIADDSCFTMRDLKRELALDTFDILNIKPARTGVVQSLEMMQLAQDAGKHIMVGSQACSGLGTVHAAVIASCQAVNCPSELSFPLKLERDSIAPQLHYEDGCLTLEVLRQVQRARTLQI